MRKIILTLVLLTAVPAASAYIGPGAGISLVGSLLTFLGAVFLGLFAVLAWPVRRMLKRRKAAREAANDESIDQAGSEENGSAPTEGQD